MAVTTGDLARQLSGIDEKRVCHALFPTSFVHFGQCVDTANHYLKAHEFVMRSVEWGVYAISHAVCAALTTKTLLRF